MGPTVYGLFGGKDVDQREARWYNTPVRDMLRRQDMKGKLGFRLIFSIAFLAIFGVYCMKHFSSGWFSDDVASWGPAGGLKP